MKTRRGPWLSGLIVALVAAVWMVGQVLGGVVSLVGGVLSVDMPAQPAAVSAPADPAARMITDAPLR